MAKRKRLTVPGEVFLDEGALGGQEPPALFAPMGAMPSAPPIARVAAEAAASAALEDLAREVSEARAGGRMILSLPLDAVEADYLVRDRVHADPEELAALMASIRERGQQVPIEVTALPEGRYGLISGWRRLTALRRLQEEDPQFGHVLAILRRPDTAATAYLAMVEENELRVGLSYYERARIVLKTVEQGVFPDAQTALARLFAPASRAKRSKIGSFLRIVQGLDGALRFPSHIPERLGLVLSRALDQDKALAERIAKALEADPALQPAAELSQIEAQLARPAGAQKTPEPERSEALPGVFVQIGSGRMTLSGPKVTADFQTRLLALLRQLGDP